MPRHVQQPKGRSRWSFRLRTLFLMLALVSTIMAYAGSYYRLSRRGAAEAREYDLSGFLYEPAEVVFASKDLKGHYQRLRFYSVANWIDRKFFGGPGPALGILFDLK